MLLKIQGTEDDAVPFSYFSKVTNSTTISFLTASQKKVFLWEQLGLPLTPRYSVFISDFY